MFKKVCILTSVHQVFDNRIFHKEAKALARAGYDVTLIAQHNKNEIVDGIKIIALQKPKNRLHRIIGLDLKVLILALKQKADIYHFHDPELLPVGVILKLLKRGKIVYDVHEDYSKQILSKSYIPIMARKTLSFLTRIIEPLSSKVFDAIITATDDIQKNFIFHKKSMTVKNFPIINSEFPGVIIKRNNNRNYFNLIYVGGLDKIRGITQIIEALEFVDSKIQVRLTLCGRFYPISYEARIRSLKGFEKVNYLGWVQLHQIPKLLSKSDAGIVCFLPEPNHINSMPTKLFEYMAAGLPVIASNFPLWQSIIEDNNCGLCVDPKNPKMIASAIKYLIDHPQNVEIMSRNALKLVLEKYNWANEGSKLLGLYKELK